MVIARLILGLENERALTVNVSGAGTSVPLAILLSGAKHPKPIIAIRELRGYAAAGRHPSNLVLVPPGSAA
jgi:hypothetical protein